MTPKAVFISYSTDDSAVAAQVREGLEASGIDCWMAPRDIVPGKDYAEQILNAIEDCEVMVLVLSETSNSSRFVRSEVERAVSKDKVIIPVRIHNVVLSRSLEFFISSAQWIEASTDLAAALDRLVGALRAYLPVQPERFPPDAGQDAAEAPAATQHNLPTLSTPFVGRKREVGEILVQLRDPNCRLLTLVGLGGMGKTRLAIAVAQRILDQHKEFADGLFFVPLETVSQPEQIPAAIATALGLPVGMGDPRRQVQSFLASRELLLILDNFEQLLEGADLVAELLATAPQIKILVTSREVLTLHEEWTYAVRGMELPDTPVDPLEQGRQSDSVQLFLQDGRRARPTLDLSTELPHIIIICRLVEGSPLALGLTARWLRTITCAQIVDELLQGLDLLTTQERNVPMRQRSMAAVFDHSWQLAGESEKNLLRQLPVFIGGFDWPAFRAVTRGTLPQLAALVESSWVRVDEAGRYTLHPLVLSYLAQKLEQEYAEKTGEEPRRVRTRHALYYASEVAKGDSAFLLRERDNVVAGFRAATEELNVESLRLFLSSSTSQRDWPLPVTQKESLFAAAVDRVRAQRLAGAAVGDNRSLRLLEATLLVWRANVLRRAWSLSRAQALAAEGLTLLEGLENQAEVDRLRLALLDQQGIILYYQGYREDDELDRKYQEVVGRLGDQVDVESHYRELHGRGRGAADEGDYALAEQYQRQGLTDLLHAGNENIRARYRFLVWLGRIAVVVGDYPRAQIHFEEAMRCTKSLFEDYEWGGEYAALELATGDPAAAIKRCQPLLQVAEEYGFVLLQLMCLEVLAKASLTLNRVDEAERYFQRIHDLTDQTRRSRQRAIALLGLGRVAFARGDYALSRVLNVEAISGAWPGRFRPEVLSAMIGLAEIEWQSGGAAQAVSWLTLVSRHPSTVHAEQVRTQEMLAKLRAALPQDAFEVAQIEGDALDLDTVVTSLLPGLSDANEQ